MIIKSKTLPNGEKVDFKDCIHYTTTTKFPFWQRVRHLFGAPVVIKSEIYCENEPGWTLTEAKGIRTNVFKSSRSRKGEMMQSPMPHENMK